MDYDRVAHLYDAYVQTELDIPFFLDEARKARGPVLELMCSTGRNRVTWASVECWEVPYDAAFGALWPRAEVEVNSCSRQVSGREWFSFV